MVRDGIYYALGMLVVAALLWWLAAPAWTAVPLLAAVFFLWFFRDPERAIPGDPGLIVSPADGKVTDIDFVNLDGRVCTRVSIFLSVFDVHVNRAPVDGVIKNVEYREGHFANAMGAASAEDNEQNIVTMESGGAIVVFKQIAGLLARRIVFDFKAGDTLARGQRVGMIKFGSRTDLIFPKQATLRVKTGDRVKGGSTVVAWVDVAASQVSPEPSPRHLAAPPAGQPAEARQ